MSVDRLLDVIIEVGRYEWILGLLMYKRNDS